MNASRILCAAVLVFLAACASPPAMVGGESGKVMAMAEVDRCDGPYPSYWQDPAFTDTGMWAGQQLSNQPPNGYAGPLFRLSQAFPKILPDDRADRQWLKFDPFRPGLGRDQRRAQAEGYIWALMRYIQAGNIDHGDHGGDVERDWDLCRNRVRGWYNMPYQTYDPLSGREYMHGLTREAPVKVTLGNGDTLATTIWAVGFYNGRGGHLLGQVWGDDGTPSIPTADQAFAEGTVVGKLLFTTATPAQLPFLDGLPTWRINLSDPAYCNCKPASGDACTFAEMSQQCPRTPGAVHLLQFDVAVRDDRAPTGWVFGTFVADGQARASEANPWNRISPLGLMWGNDPPPAGVAAHDYPVDPRVNGFAQEEVFWDVAERLNRSSDAGHLGCDGRLNGPADNIASSCMSCHMTASVPDEHLVTPPIIAQFGGLPAQCATPANLASDAAYFANTACATPFDGGSVVPGPHYASGRTQWISLDYSLQLSISLGQWGEWNQHRQQAALMTEGEVPVRHAMARLPSR